MESSSKTRKIYFYVSYALAIYLLVLDFFLPLDLKLGLAYAFIMIFAIFQQGIKPVIRLASVLSVFVVAGSFFSVGEMSWSAILVERLFNLVLVWAAAFLILKFKQLEQDRLVSERQFEQTLNDAPVPIFITRASDNQLLYVNEAGADFLKLPKKKLVGSAITKYDANPQEREELMRLMDEYGEVDIFEMQLRLADNSVATILSSVKPIRFRAEDAIITVNADVTAQKKAEKKFRDLLEAAPESMLIINHHGDILMANKKAESLFGYKRNALQDVPISLLISEDVRELGLLGESATAGHEELEIIGIRQDSSSFPAEISINPIETEEGVVYSASVRDVTERKKYEQEIIQSRNYYLTLLEEFPSMIWRTSKDGQCDYFNKTWLNFTGKTLEEELGEGWKANVYAKDLERVVSTFNEHFSKQEPFYIEYRLKRHDGQYRWVNNVGRPMHDPEGNFTGYLGSCHDITEERQAEQAIRETVEKLNNAQHIAHLGSWEWDIKNNVVTWSDEMFRIYGYEPRSIDVSYEKYIEHIHPEERDFVENLISETLENKSSFDNTYRVIRKDGKELILHSLGETILDSKGNVKRMVGTCHDVTQLKHTEAQLKESQRFVKQVADSSPNVLFVFNLSTQTFEYINEQANTATGYTVRDLERMQENPLREIIHPDDHALLKEKIHQILAMTDDEVLEFQVRIVRKDERVRWFNLRNTVFKRDANGVPVQSIGTAQDVTEQKVAEDEITLYHNISQIIGEAKDYNSALFSTIKMIAETTNWEYGEIWIPDADKKQLEFGPVHYAKSSKFNGFLEKSRTKKFPFGVNLAGEIWKNRDVVWIPDVQESTEKIFPRIDAATEAGIKGALAVPVIDKDQVIAVMIFLTSESTTPDESVIHIISTVSNQIGTLIQRKRADDTLKNLLESAPDAILIIDKHLKMQRVNEQTEQVFGYSRQHIIGQPSKILFAPHVQDSLDSFLQKLFSEIDALETGQKIETVALKQDGVEFPCEISLTPIETDEGIFIYATIRDVTERKSAEEKIRKSEEKFRHFVETSNDLIWSLDLEDRWTYLNPQACREIYGVEPEEMLGQRFYEGQPEAIQAQDKEFLKKIREQESYYHYETTHINNEGERVNLKFNGKALASKSGEIIGVTGTAADITRLKTAEKFLRQTANALRELHEITTEFEDEETEEKIQALLKLACEKFDMDLGFVMKVKQGENKVEQIFRVNSLLNNVNDVLLEELQFNPALDSDEPIMIPDISKSPFANIDKVQTMKICSFISEKIELGNQVYGTVNFIAKDVKDKTYSPTDIEILKLMAQWLGSVLQQEQNKQNIINAIVETEESERKRFAEDLHDGLSQIISAIKLNLTAIETSFTDTKPEIARYFDNVKGLVDHAMIEAKTMSQNLMPAALDNYGLVNTFESLCEKMEQLHDISINFHSFNIDKRLNKNIEIGLYRIGQELIINSIKHAKASELNLQLILHKNSVMLMAEDDGVGFKPEKDVPGKGFKNIITRVKSLHGTFTIDSAPGQGTIATVEIPLNL